MSSSSPVDSREAFRQIVRENLVYLIDTLELEYILNYFIQEKKMTKRKAETISRNPTRFQSAEKFCDFLMQSCPAREFRDALRESDQEIVLTHLYATDEKKARIAFA